MLVVVVVAAAVAVAVALVVVVRAGGQICGASIYIYMFIGGARAPNRCSSASISVFRVEFARVLSFVVRNLKPQPATLQPHGFGINRVQPFQRWSCVHIHMCICIIYIYI